VVEQAVIAGALTPEILDDPEEARRKAEAVARNLDALAREGEPLTVNKDKIGDRPSGEMDPEHPLVQRAMAVTNFMGQPPYLSRSSTNSNTPISLGVPAVTIGRGGIGANGHALDEYWVNREGWKAVQRALLLTLTEAGLPGVT